MKKSISNVCLAPNKKNEILQGGKKMNDLLTVDDLSMHDIERLIQRALSFKNANKLPKYSSTVVNIFYENSTRTKYSFHQAERKLGLDIINFEPESSSMNKGESLYDTLLTFQALGAGIAVIRHPDEKFYEELKGLKMAIINAGAGAGAHPTQSLLDIMTLYEEFHTFKDLKVAIVGDLKHSRVAKSNMKLLKKLGAKLYFCSPKEYQDPIFSDYGEYKELDDIIEIADAVMLLRIQNERHIVQFSNLNYCNLYGMNQIRYGKLKENAIIMHPGPINRNVEISEELIEAPKSRFFMQMTNGVYMRMAILEMIIQRSEVKDDLEKRLNDSKQWFTLEKGH